MAHQSSMHRSHLPRSGMALGGIGTGSFEIRQDGSFANWTIFNNQPVFTGPQYPFNPKQSLFFVLRVQVQNENPRLILLQIEDSHGAASLEHHEFHYIFPWLSGVDFIQTTASFPFADLNYEQEGLPLRITLRAWSPFIPGKVKDSALPTAFFDFNIESLSDRPIDVQIVASTRNAIGYDQPTRAYKNRRIMDGHFSAVCMENSQMEPNAQTTGNMTLVSLAQDSTAYSGWEHHHPYYEILLKENQLPEIDDTNGRNHLDKSTNLPKADPRCFISMAKRKVLAQRGDSLAHCFVLAWYFPNNFGRPINDTNLKAGYMEDETFPNHKSNSSKTHDHRPHKASLEGHYYQHHFNSSEEVARYAAREKQRLLEESIQFHRCFFDSSLPAYVLDQINSQLNTFRTSTWLTRTNMFGVLEGLNPTQSFAGIATTDVAMYGQIATSLLFPELDKMTVDIWSKFQKPNGVVVHSVTCNSQEISPNEATGGRLDMPAQYSFQALRCALWSQNKAYLRQVWPHVKKALAYVLRERDFNNDKCPDMQGIMCSYDNFPMHGVAPYVVSQWLAAISLALVAAKQLSDQIFIDEYQPYLKSGCHTMEEKTWNGKYFNLYSDQQNEDPKGMLGCMSDQIIGDGLVRQMGLPALVDPEKAHIALRSILQMNYKSDQGLRNCQWPGDQFLHKVEKDTWVDQANTCWTGVELNFAAQLFYSGLHEDAFEIIRNVDDRHRKWGMYWDHQEFGGHYFRPMSALAIPGAFLGLSYDGETLCIAPARPLPVGRWCVILPGAYGTYSQTPDGGKLDISNGKLQVSTVILPAIGNVEIFGLQGTFSKKEDATQSIFKIMNA